MITLDVEIDADDWAGADGIEALAQGAAEAAIASLAEAPSGQLAATLLLTDDGTIRGLNREWRGQDKATNVLSFPSGAPAHPGGGRHLGDIALAYGTVAREAAAEGKTLRDHAAHLVVHGVLHLVGHDHMDDREADAMERTEVQALSRLGIADPYRERPAEGEFQTSR